MSTQTAITIVVALLIISVGFLIIFSKGLTAHAKTTKSPKIKKDEIIEKYKNELEDILKRYQNNKDEQIAQKKLFLQKVTSELSRNIYFSKEENKQIIEKLASL